MKTKTLSLMRRYHAALSNHIESDDDSNLRPARALGHQSLKLGMKPLDLARLHEAVLHSLILRITSGTAKKRAALQGRDFFAEAMTAMEENHTGEPMATAPLKVMADNPSRPTKEYSASKERLKEEMHQPTSVKKQPPGSGLTSIELLNQSRWSQEQLRDLSRRLVSAQEEDKGRISHELSNGIAQVLTSINTRLDALKEQPTVTIRDFQKKLSLTQRLIAQSVDAVHRIARDLRPAVLDDLGLVPALQSYMKFFFKQTGIRVTFTACGSLESLNGDARIVLYRVAQEALSNVAKHAKGSHVELNLRESRGFTIMEVRNTRNGFQVTGAQSTNDVRHLGILGMRERVEMIGGTFCVKSAPHKGTTIRAEIPRVSARVGNQPPVSSIFAPLEYL